MAKPKPFDSIEQLVELLRETNDLDAEGEVSDALTSAELIQRTGLPTRRINTLLHVLMDNGQLEHVKVKRKLINGAVKRIDAYRVKV